MFSNPGFEWTSVKLHKQANGNNNNSSRRKNNNNTQQQQRRRQQTRSLEAVGSCVPIDTGLAADKAVLLSGTTDRNRAICSGRTMVVVI